MRVAIYARVSTEEQAEDGFSIEGQIKSLTDYCIRNNWEVLGVYKDEGLSGKSLARPNLQRMLKECTNGSVDMVMVWKVSRLSRKQLDFLNVIELLNQNDVAFFSLMENIDASTPTGKAMLQMMGTFAELERNQIVENVKMGMNQRAREGLWNGGAILGYASVDGRLAIVEEEALVVRRIFEHYAEGKGYKAIVNILNHQGFKTKKNKSFSMDSVKRIVTNPVYAGFVRFNRVEHWSEKRRKGTSIEPLVVQGKHDPIIDMNTWVRAKDMYERKSHQMIKTFTGHFPLTGLLRCPKCGGSMIGHKMKKSKGSNDYIRYYQCGEFHRKGSAVCRSNLVHAEQAEATVFQRLEELVSRQEVLPEIVNHLNTKIAKHKDPLIESLKFVENQIEKTRLNLNKYFTLFEGGKVSGELLKVKLQSLEQELADLQAQKADIHESLSKPTIQEISLTDIQRSLAVFAEVLPQTSPERQKEFLHSIIREITVNQSSNINTRTVNDIQLFFDISVKGVDYVPSGDTVPLAKFECLDKVAPAIPRGPTGEAA